MGYSRTISLMVAGAIFSRSDEIKRRVTPLLNESCVRLDILFNRKRNVATGRYLFRRCELAAASSRRQIDRAGRRLRDGRCRVARGIGAFGFATVRLATAIEIRQISVEIQENPQGYHGRAALRLVRQ